MIKKVFYKKFIIIFLLLLYIKNGQYNLLSKKQRYCKNNNERLKKQARGKYRNLSEEDKNKNKNTEKIDIIICLKKKSKN